MTDVTSPLAELSRAGVSVWLDDLSRQRIVSGDLQRLIDERHVVGVTTNPTIFANALSDSDDYSAQIAELAKQGKTPSEAVVALTTHDVATGCDLFRKHFLESGGKDGRVSIEVEPALAHDAAGSIREGKLLWNLVDRENVMIKVPATVEGLEAITELTAVGISVNVTLIFSLQRHREVINAYLTGLEKAKAAGLDLSKIRSVASFFVSRVDTEIDKRLDAMDSDEARSLRGKAGIANARLAYEVFEQAFASERAKLLLASGANLQRPLWASTGVKDPAFRDTLYVEELVAENVINTMPEKTMEATFEHGVIKGDTVSGTYAESNEVLDRLAGLGISYNEVTDLLEKEGIEKFAVSWNQLLQTVQDALNRSKES